MKLSFNDLFLLSQCAISAAYQAGRLIAEKSYHPITVNTKQGGESLASQVVTEVDHLSQDIILQILLPTCERFDLALLSEERPDNRQRLEKDYFWCIDPLDGTLPFIESIPGYAVSIALVSRDGEAHLGVIYDPVEQTLYHAIKGHGAFCNSKPLKLNAIDPALDQKLTFITDRSFADFPLFDTVRNELDVIAGDLSHAGSVLLLQGGAAMNACQVLEESAACYFKFPKPQPGGGSVWDYAATACLFREAGAVACDIEGNPLPLNGPDSTYMNHCGVIYASHSELAERIINLYARLKVN
ncbi:MAG: inositol monophosphatase [Methylomicrobium sp.]|nr:inositol monophosphatase [Methylomicrobium sp.]